MQCDLLEVGLVPGVDKCIWTPARIIEWNGLRFDFAHRGISMLNKRILATNDHIMYLLEKWPRVTFREVTKGVGHLGSMSLRGLGTSGQRCCKRL